MTRENFHIKNRLATGGQQPATTMAGCNFPPLHLVPEQQEICLLSTGRTHFVTPEWFNL